jgi:VWFA-related protein
MGKQFLTMERVAAALLLTVAFFAGPARAEVSLRVDAQPITGPIQAFVSVTDANGDPVAGLTPGDFIVTLDNDPITLSGFTLPPDQNSSRKVSVVIVMDYSLSVQNTFLAAMQDSVVSFINAMKPGDFAAIVKFNLTNPDKASVVQPFTQIDGAAGTSALISAVMAPYPGSGTNLLDAVDLAVKQFLTPPDGFPSFPSGPKAVIAITDGADLDSLLSQSGVVDNANGANIPIFTIGVGDVNQTGLDLLNNLATQTGGDYVPAPTDPEITAAYATISMLLNTEYRLTIPSPINDICGTPHTLQVVWVTEPATPASVTFQRCDTTPSSFSFTNQTGVARGAVVTSNAVTISEIEAPTLISVTGGEYSIGCGSTFTSSDGTISLGQTVCVRHTASSAFSTAKVTILMVGGVSGTFTSTTGAAPPPKSRGGGGAMGVVELLAGLVALAARRRRSVHSSQMRIT